MTQDDYFGRKVAKTGAAEVLEAFDWVGEASAKATANHGDECGQMGQDFRREI